MLQPTIEVSGNLETGKIWLTCGIQPPTDEGTIMDQTKIHSDMQSYASGGSVQHVFLGEVISPEQKSKMIKSLFGNYTLRYMSFTPILTVCNACGSKVAGKHTECSCGSDDVTVWSRPVGYFRPVLRKEITNDFKDAKHTFWLSSRTEEFSRRKELYNSSVSEMIEELQEIV